MTDIEKFAALHTFFYPGSIAVIGASENPDTFGSRYLNALIKFGYRGKLYAINPNVGQIFGIRIYPSLFDIPDTIDLAVISVPARIVASVLRDCLKKNIRATVVLSAGFSEVGDGGRLLEEELTRIAKQDIRIIGPNCFGVYCPIGGLTLIPGAAFPKESGGAALISQSGQFSEMIVLRSMGEGIRFSKVISYGNACDVNEVDLLEYLAEDTETKVILAYIEGVKEGRRFLDIVRKTSKTKPIIIWKAGLTRSGKVAASSHTGSIAGESAIWDAFFRQSGAIKVSSVEELIDAAIAFTCWPSDCGSRVALVSGGGGGAVIGADACELSGLTLPTFTHETGEKLASIIPGIGTCIRNPVDIANPAPPVKFLTAILEIIASSEQIDVIIIRRIFLSVKASKTVIGYATVSEAEQQQLMNIPIMIKTKYGKLLVIVLSEEMTGSDMLELEAERRKMRDYYFANGIPVYPTVNRAVTAIAHLARYRQRLKPAYEQVRYGDINMEI